MSLPAAILVSKPDVDFKNLLFLCKSFLNRSISAGLDKQNRPAKDAAGYICLLDEFAAPGSEPSFSLQEAGDLLKHLHFSFLCAMMRRDYITLLEKTGLHFTVSEEMPEGNVLAMVSGTLSEWRTCVICLSTTRANQSERHFANKILEQLDLQGLSQLFAAYSRARERDGTVLLLERKTP